MYSFFIFSLAVITNDTFHIGPKRLFDFFVNNDIKTFDFLPQEPIFSNTGEQLTSYLYPTENYVKFVNELFDIWFERDDPNIHILLFKDILRTILGHSSKICQIGQGICANVTFTLYPNGSIYPCDKFPRTGNTIVSESEIANINNIKSISGIFAAEGYRRLLQKQIESLKVCLSCKWYDKCKGGCAYDRYLLNSKTTNPAECSNYKIYEHIYNKIKDQLET